MESHKLEKRVAELEAFFSFLSNAKAEIRYSALPVERIVAKHGKKQKFLVLCSQYSQQGESFAQAWQHGLQEGMATTGLTRQDLDYIRDFGLGFGMTDLEGQLAHCQLYIEFIGKVLTTAREEKQKKQRLYLMLGLFGGIAAALVLS